MPDSDAPRPLGTCWLSWIAVPTGDQPGVMATLGLTGPVPVTFAEAEQIVEDDGHDGVVTRVYVSPELAGWTLVIGPWCDPSDPDRASETLRPCAELSARYGRAHAYWFGLQGDGSVWLIAEAGVVRRRYSAIGEGYDAPLTLGDPLPEERARREALGLAPTWDDAERDGEAEEEWQVEAYGLAAVLADELGVSPLELTAETPMRGVGVVARTPSEP